MNHDTLNDRAQERFKQLQQKLKLNFIESIKEETKNISEDKINKMFDRSQDLDKEEINIISETPGLADAINEAEETEQTLDFITSLRLPPQLSLAIGLIIAGHKTDSLEDLNKAWCEIKDYTTDKWNEKYGKRKEETNSQGT